MIQNALIYRYRFLARHQKQCEKIQFHSFHNNKIHHLLQQAQIRQSDNIIDNLSSRGRLLRGFNLN